MEKDIKQEIKGNNNTQVAGDLIKTEKVIKKTEVVYNSDLHITDAQALEIKDKVTKIAQSRAGETKFKNKPPFGLVYGEFYKRFKITSYKLLQIEHFDDACKWLDKQIAINRKSLKNVDEEQFRKDLYKSINARANQKGINIYDFAETALSLKKPIISLKELSNTRLQKLYTKLYSLK